MTKATECIHGRQATICAVCAPAADAEFEKVKAMFVCPDCGEQDHMLFDASSILERQFEGLWFVLRRDANGKLYAEGMKEDKDYLEDFNMEKHLKTAVEIALDGRTDVYCPKCEDSLE